MRILLLAGEFPPFRGGIATYAVELAIAAAQLGHDVTVVAPDYGADQTDVDHALPFTVQRFRGGVNTPKAILAKTLLVRRLARRERFEMVHAVDWPFFIPLALSRFRKHSRCLLTFHGREVGDMQRPSRRRLLSAIGFWRDWALLVANSRFTAQHLLSSFPAVRAERVRATGLGVRPLEAGATSRGAARVSMAADDGDFVLISLGRLVERKGHMLALEALRRLPEAVQRHIVWYVVGPEIDPHYAARLKAAAADLQVRVHFTGSIANADVDRLLAGADTLILPGKWIGRGDYEGFGLVYLEAGLRGVPSVAARVGGIPDAIMDGETGILTDPDDVAALAEAVRTLVANPAERQRLGDNARALAQRTTWLAVAEATYA